MVACAAVETLRMARAAVPFLSCRAQDAVVGVDVIAVVQVKPGQPEEKVGARSVAQGEGTLLV